MQNKQWEAFRRAKLQKMASECPKILDFGASARGDKQLFREGQYTTADLDPSTRPDIVADICELHMIPDASYDGIICCAVLEHVYDPFRAVEEMKRVLKPGGQLFAYVPFLYGYHARPGAYSDYYRFTHEGVQYLFRKFHDIDLCAVRGNFSTLMNLLPGKLGRLQSVGVYLDRFFSNTQVSGYNIHCVN